MLKETESLWTTVAESKIAQGFSGDNLLEEFKSKQAKVRPAVEAMIADADEVANGNGEYATYDDVFNAENDE